MESFIFATFNGVLYGMLLFLLASGLTLIFSMMGVLNFAHASFFMLGAYFAYQITEGLNFWTALIVAPLLVGIVGAGVERWGLRPVHRYGHVAELLFTFGIAYVIEELVQMVWGRVPVQYEIPEVMAAPLFTWQGFDYSIYRVFMLGVSVVIFVALFAVLTHTRIGLIIRAAVSDPTHVATLGHDIPRIFMWTFGFGCALAGVAGVVGGNVLGTEPAMAIQLGPIVFVVIVIGGLGSLSGALVAALIIGVVTRLAIFYDYGAGSLLLALGVEIDTAGLLRDFTRITTAQVAPVLPYLMLVLMLIFKPRGLFGTRDV